MSGSSRVHDYNTVPVGTIEATLTALRELNPDALCELRDMEGDDETIADEWATRHYLNSPAITYCLAERRRFWRLVPAKAARLEFGGGWESPLVVSIPSYEKERWVAEQFASENRAALLPNPGNNAQDIWINCRSCAVQFCWSVRDQEFFKRMDFSQPQNCKDYCDARKIQRRCGNGPDSVPRHLN
jgi:hypothetical protein